MADLRRVIPEDGPVEITRVVPELRVAQTEMEPFAAPVLEFAEDLSRRLRKHPRVRTAPALAALAHWIRPSGVAVLRDHWDRIGSVPGIVRAPRGVVFHLPPTNVDTLFVYTWLISALAGNANVIRLSPSAVETGGMLLETVGEAITDHPVIASTTAVLSYGHDSAVTAELSRADMRVIWGGDEAVKAIRAVPLAPHATELVFPDRFSFVALGASAVVEATAAEMGSVIDQFVNDAYWFDQLGCSSPRLIVWVGDEAVAGQAAGRFRGALVEHLRREQRDIPTSAVMAKLVFAAVQSAEGAAERVDWSDNEATFMTLTSLESLDRHGPGGGMFQQVRVDSLEDVVGHISKSDQTVTHWGLTGEQLTRFVGAIGARGIERIVPVGRALEFSNHWDGHDLLHAFSRGVVVDTSEPRSPLGT